MKAGDTVTINGIVYEMDQGAVDALNAWSRLQTQGQAKDCSKKQIHLCPPGGSVEEGDLFFPWQIQAALKKE